MFFLKSIFVTVILVLSVFVHAQEFSDSKIQAKYSEIPMEKLRYKFEIEGELLIFNKQGTRLLSRVNQENKWRFGNEKPIKSYWTHQQKDLPSIAIYHEWQFNENGELQMKYIQYDHLKKGTTQNSEVVLGKILQQKDMIIENFSIPPVILFQEENRRIIAQFKIHVWPDENPINIEQLAINSSRMTIYDSKGHLWASKIDNSSGNNVYFSITTYRGTIYLSYKSFKGSKKIGFATKDRIQIEDKNLKIYIESPDYFLPRGIQANVYGFIDFNKQTDKLYSVKTQGTDKEDTFLESFKN